jgi:hypothetical protein
MNPLLIPQPDAIPVNWGWFQFLLLLTFPLHLLAMNAMLGGLAIGLAQQINGGELGKKLAHRIAVALPLVIAFVVNFGVAPLLFAQVLYGQFLYSSSVLMGVYWILIIPILILAYYGAYLYDFKWKRLGSAGVWLGTLVLVMLLIIGFFLSNNMLLMVSPERFSEYFGSRGGNILATSQAELWPRYLHMVTGSLAVGGLFVGLLGRFRKNDDLQLAAHADRVGLKTFFYLTLVNVVVGFWYFMTLPGRHMMLFLGGSAGATICFLVALLLALGALWASYRGRFWLTFSHAVSLVVLMSFMRSWLRSSYLSDVFTLDQLKVVPEYSPMVFFFVTLVAGLLCIGWMLKKTAEALR